MDESAPLVETIGVEKEYLSRGVPVRALQGVDFTLEQGEFTALAGPSGSGKTTLLNLIGGLDTPTAGTVRVAGTDLSELSSKALAEMRLHRIGFVFQAYNLIPVLTAFENVEYVLLLQHVPRKERQERAEAVLEQVGLSEHLHRRPHELSGGQQQRVAVARAIVSSPDIVLADEPTANLDQATGARLLDLMRRLNESPGVAFLFSTHDPMVMERARRLLQLKDGRIDSDEFRQA